MITLLRRPACERGTQSSLLGKLSKGRIARTIERAQTQGCRPMHEGVVQREPFSGFALTKLDGTAVTT